MGFSAGGILSGEMLLHFDGTVSGTALDPDYVPAPQEYKDVFGVTFQQGRKPKNTWLFLA